MTENKKSWASEGFDGVKGEEERLATMYGPNRVWIPPGGSQEWVFITDTPFCFHEHNPKIGGNFKNWLTCLKNVSEDGVPCCEILGDKSRYYTGYFTVVDLSKWTDKKGNVHQYEVKLVGAKLKTLKKLERKKKDRGTLIGSIFKVTREDDKSPNVGDDFEFVREASLEKLFDVANYKGKKLAELYAKAIEDPTQMNVLKKTFDLQLGDDKKPLPKIPSFNYYSIFEPKAAKDVKSMLANVKIEDFDDDTKDGGGSKSTSGGGADETVPF